MGRFIGDTEPTVDDFRLVDLQAILSKSKDGTCSSYSEALSKSYDEAYKIDPESGQAKVFGVLAYLCSLCFPDEDQGTPLIDRGGNAVQLSQAQRDVLQSVFPTLGIPELEARIADVLWWLRHGKNYEHSSHAVRAYLESAKALENPVEWLDTYARIRRALTLALAMNNSKDRDDVIQYAEDLVARLDGKDPLYLSVRLHELLYEKNLVDASRYAVLAEAAAQFDPSDGSHADHRRSRAHWENAARWHLRAGNTDASRNAWINAAETHVAEANAHAADSPARASLASRDIRDAIEAYRQIPDTSTRQEKLRQLLLELQAQVRDELTPIVSTRDLSETVSAALTIVEGKSFDEALRTLAELELSPKWSELRTAVEQITVEHPLLHLIPSDLLNAQGQVVARRSSISDDREGAIVSSMFQEANRRRDFVARAILGPILNALNTGHYYTEWDLRPYIVHKPFVPEGRQRIYSRALLAGLRGDLLQSTHYLVNQLENSIRHLLVLRGAITTSLTNQGIQSEFTLNALYERYEEQIKDILGEDIAYDLKGLLIEQWGSNLRNLTDHGLLDDDEFYSTQALYLWWLTLHLCHTLVFLPSAPETTDEA